MLWLCMKKMRALEDQWKPYAMSAQSPTWKSIALCPVLGERQGLLFGRQWANGAQDASPCMWPPGVDEAWGKEECPESSHPQASSSSYCSHFQIAEFPYLSLSLLLAVFLSDGPLQHWPHPRTITNALKYILDGKGMSFSLSSYVKI